MARSNLFGLGESHTHYSRTPQGDFVEVSKRSKSKKAKESQAIWDDWSRPPRRSAGEMARARAPERNRCHNVMDLERRFVRAWNAAKLGSGERFKKLTSELSKRPGVYDPKGLAAWIGRQKYGKAAFQKLAQHHRNNPDIIDQLVGTAEGLTDQIYQVAGVPYDLTKQAATEVLKGKDYLKTHVLGMKKSNRRRNSAEEADAAFESFHGAPPDEAVIVEEELHVHENLWTLGLLLWVAIDTPTGIEAVLNFDNSPYLTASEDGRQLYIEAGDQSIDLAKLDMDSEAWLKDRMILGTFAPPRCLKCMAEIEKKGGAEFPDECPECGNDFKVSSETGLPDQDRARSGNIAYQTRKSFDDFDLVDYEHDLGEPPNGKSERTEAPALEYDPRSIKLYVAGGNYVIELPAQGVSPGIEN